jgi:hypothetical protein
MTFYMGRAGITRPAAQPKRLEREKDELRDVYGRSRAR